MRCARSWSASSAVVAIWMSSHPSGVLETAAHMAVESPLSSSSDCGAMDMPARSEDGILGLLRGQSTVGAVTSSWSGIFAGFVAPVGWRERASLVLLRIIIDVWDVDHGEPVTQRLLLQIPKSGVWDPGICPQTACREACGRLQQ